MKTKQFSPKIGGEGSLFRNSVCPTPYPSLEHRHVITRGDPQSFRTETTSVGQKELGSTDREKWEKGLDKRFSKTTSVIETSHLLTILTFTGEGIYVRIRLSTVRRHRTWI